MDKLLRKNFFNPYLISILSVSIVSILCLFIRDTIDYRIVGYILLVLVSILAVFFEIKPVLLAAILSSLALDFLFINPYYTLHVDNAEDAFLLVMFFIIALINAVLTNKLRIMQTKIQEEESRVKTLKLYNTLLDSLSHELRTPIAAILGSIDILQQQDVNLSRETHVKLHSEIEKATMKLNYHVENLLNMSRLESGYIQPKLDWCDIKEIIYNVTDRLSEETSEHKIKFVIDEDLPLYRLDYGLFDQVVHNLIYNCSQHTPKGALIKITVKFDDDFDVANSNDLNSKLILIISDDGYGFPPENIHKAFDKFYRFKNSKTGGTGLGLSIVKGFVEAQNGTISLRNNVNGGATFELIFNVECLSINSLKNE